jgi:cysteinyl-tRNA synthetase
MGTMLHLYNTASRQVEPFLPHHPDRVQLFVCGPTVYDLSHAGHAKTYTQFDFIARYLGLMHDVQYLINITDVDDKIIRRAAETGRQPIELARDFESAFWEDMAWLRNRRVSKVARASDYIEEVVSQVTRLRDMGVAYQTSDGWYFDISQAPHYGYLSHAPYTESGVSRVETSQKRNSGDFALWKNAKPGEPVWDTPLGAGRPGWHIEDTAITERVFGPQYDIHGGALDLIFPHHEAELAQMETLSGLHPMVRSWLHTGFLTVNGEKMAKSAGNFTTIRQLRGEVEALTLRYVFLTQHYRSSFDLTETRLAEAKAVRTRVEAYWQQLGHDTNAEASAAVENLRGLFYNELDNDLNTPAAFAHLFDFIREANRLDRDHGLAMREFLQELNVLFEIFDADATPALTADLRELVETRAELRRARQWAAADAVRERLTAAGVTLEDTPDGTKIWRNGKLVAG